MVLRKQTILLDDWQIKKMADFKLNKSETIRTLLNEYFENSEEVLEAKEKQLMEELEMVKKKKEDREIRLQEFYKKNELKANKVYLQIYKHLKDSYDSCGEFISNEYLPELLAEYYKLTGTKAIDTKNKIIEEIKNARN